MTIGTDLIRTGVAHGYPYAIYRREAMPPAARILFEEVESLRGWFCGYLAIPKDHPWHGMDHENIPMDDPEVFGGLTFSDNYNADQLKGWAPGEGVWILGFDTAHTPVLSDSQANRRVASDIGLLAKAAREATEL